MRRLQRPQPDLGCH